MFLPPACIVRVDYDDEFEENWEKYFMTGLLSQQFQTFVSLINVAKIWNLTTLLKVF